MQRIERGLQVRAIGGIALGFAARGLVAGKAALLRLLFELVEQSHLQRPPHFPPLAPVLAPRLGNALTDSAISQNAV